MLERMKRLKQALLVNSLIVLFEVVVFAMLISNFGRGFDLSCVQYYTHYANLFSLLTSLGISIELAREITGRTPRTSYFSRLMRFMAVSTSTLTLVVVVFLLLPMDQFENTGELLFYHTNFLEHIFCPVLSFYSFVFLGDYRDMGTKEAVVATLPTLLYAIVSTTLNALGIMEGPYPFLLVYKQPLWLSILYFILIVGGAYVISWVLIVLAHKDNPDEKGIRNQGKKVSW